MKRGGCFQRRLFACQFVSVFVCTITSERLNIGRSNLAVRYTVQKSPPSSKVKVKGQGHQGQKKTAQSSPLTMHSRACAVARPYATRSTQQQTIPLRAARGWRAAPVGKSAHAVWYYFVFLRQIIWMRDRYVDVALKKILRVSSSELLNKKTIKLWIALVCFTE